MPSLALWELWLASLQVVVQGYDRSHKHPDSLLSDPAIDALLDPHHRETLRKFRNAIFHPEFIDHPDAAAVLKDYHTLTGWADRLMRAFARLFRSRLSSDENARPRPA